MQFVFSGSTSTYDNVYWDDRAGQIKLDNYNADIKSLVAHILMIVARSSTWPIQPDGFDGGVRIQQKQSITTWWVET